MTTDSLQDLIPYFVYFRNRVLNIVLNITSLSRLTLQYYGAAYEHSLQFSVLYVRIWYNHSYKTSTALWYVLAITICDRHTFTDWL